VSLAQPAVLWEKATKDRFEQRRFGGRQTMGLDNL
jgi:hypothetical protein